MVKTTSTIEVSYRDIAKMLCQAIPEDGENFSQLVEDYLEAIKRMTSEQKTALKMAYIFSRKVPKEEREDLFQELALTLLKAKVKDEKLAYAIARCDWRDWWKKYTIREHFSLDSVIDDGDGNEITLAETLVGETEFELKMDGKLDAERIWDKLPTNIKPIVQRRLIGKPLNANDRQTLSRYVRKYGYALI